MASLFESVQVGNHVFVFYQGQLIYKRWIDPRTGKKIEPSMIFNETFPNQRVTS